MAAAGSSFDHNASHIFCENVGKGSAVFALVAGIELARLSETADAKGGRAELLIPWDCDFWAFEPTVFRARRIEV